MAAEIPKMKNADGWINMTTLGRYGTDYNTRAGVAYMGSAPTASPCLR